MLLKTHKMIYLKFKGVTTYLSLSLTHSLSHSHSLTQEKRCFLMLMSFKMIKMKYNIIKMYHTCDMEKLVFRYTGKFMRRFANVCYDGFRNLIINLKNIIKKNILYDTLWRILSVCFFLLLLLIWNGSIP